uniref:Uncharacterized protein n=1 Tax=Anguilla anguilla TaxID=7936 RepID=A0A0E9Q0I3_ANGAN
MVSQIRTCRSKSQAWTARKFSLVMFRTFVRFIWMVVGRKKTYDDLSAAGNNETVRGKRKKNGSARR